MSISAAEHRGKPRCADQRDGLDNDNAKTQHGVPTDEKSA
jgi:hypothetical protein